jgi:hypothetical protein
MEQEHAIPSLALATRLARYRIRQFCEFGLQTSHTCAVFFGAHACDIFGERKRKLTIFIFFKTNNHQLCAAQ